MGIVIVDVEGGFEELGGYTGMYTVTVQGINERLGGPGAQGRES